MRDHSEFPKSSLLASTVPVSLARLMMVSTSGSSGCCGPVSSVRRSPEAAVKLTQAVSRAAGALAGDAGLGEAAQRTGQASAALQVAACGGVAARRWHGLRH